MEIISLLSFVFVLGLRHGLDADHLACIDGLTRYNIRQGRATARWVGTLFSFGHGAAVASIGVVLAMVSQQFAFPDYFDTVVTWVSIVSLFLIGTLNILNLIRTGKEESSYELRGVKGRFIPRIARETTNPFMIILIGAIFALAADTVSQTSVWALASGNSAGYMPIVLGITFMAGMMLTDTIDSLLAYRMIKQSSTVGRKASRVMGWVIVALAYGVSFYEAFTFFFPWAELDFEIVGVVIFLFLLACFFGVVVAGKKQRSMA